MSIIYNANDSNNGNIASRVKGEIISLLPINLRNIFDKLDTNAFNALEEIRFRENKPLILKSGDDEIYLNQDGIVNSAIKAYKVTLEDIQKTLHLISQCSIYAIEEELRNGYLTLPGGHRVGFVGEVVLDNGKAKSLKHISSLNIRLAKEVLGCADKVMPYLYDEKNNRAYHTLIVSPPRCGKTTLLRDIIRQFSNGVSKKNIGFNVGLVDERSEIAACYLGSVQNNVGIRTDVLDGCSKAEGMLMLVRSMSPQIIATDEIGRVEDVQALEEIINSGVTVITTVHGYNVHDIQQRPSLQALINRKIFDRYIILGRTLGPGTIEEILDAKTNSNLITRPIQGGGV
ncbi:stage III sporulation protein AA [Bacillota bacterium LX-D]|nr:stage III sporulation protein AA [Bacillota bacterium LX-D]